MWSRIHEGIICLWYSYSSYSQEKKDQLFVHDSRAGCQELQIKSIVYVKTCEQQLSDGIGEPCTQPSLFQRLLTLKHTFYRAAAENQSKIQQCGNGGVRSIAFSGNCSGEEQSGSPLLGSAKLLPVETAGRLVWKHQIHFVHIPGFHFSEFQMDFQIVASHASAVWWTLEVWLWIIIWLWFHSWKRFNCKRFSLLECGSMVISQDFFFFLTVEFFCFDPIFSATCESGFSLYVCMDCVWSRVLHLLAVCRKTTYPPVFLSAENGAIVINRDAWFYGLDFCKRLWILNYSKHLFAAVLLSRGTLLSWEVEGGRNAVLCLRTEGYLFIPSLAAEETCGCMLP